ncbi:PQQ-binding-like beta-propeller repeat protein [Candidatus Rariloculus sp.]|uniref:outer membrane protein assembly factor BamB family protein n=1 Tax=Candidatus Rariloculus sp. TaxID=3101265 RepID=UPI003D0AD74D
MARLRALSFGLSLLVAVGGPAAAQQHAGQYDQVDIEYGAQIFAERCVAFHGERGDLLPQANLPGFGRQPVNNWTEEVGNGAILARDPRTGEQVWRFPTTDISHSGILTTATDLLFTGSREGYFYALDARSGELL